MYFRATRPYETAGWLSPNGDLYPVEFGGHWHGAEYLLEHLNIPCGNVQEDERLIQLGWLRIESDGTVYSNNPPSQTQINYIFDMIQVAHSTLFINRLNEFLERQD